MARLRDSFITAAIICLVAAVAIGLVFLAIKGIYFAFGAAAVPIIIAIGIFLCIWLVVYDLAVEEVDDV